MSNIRTIYRYGLLNGLPVVETSKFVFVGNPSQEPVEGVNEKGNKFALPSAYQDLQLSDPRLMEIPGEEGLWFWATTMNQLFSPEDAAALPEGTFVLQAPLLPNVTVFSGTEAQIKAQYEQALVESGGASYG